LTKSEIGNNQKQIEARITEKQNFETEKRAFSAERYGLFGNKRVEDEEKRLKESIEHAENAKTEAEKSSINAHTEHEKIQAIITEKEKELTEKSLENITEKTVEELQTEYSEKKQQSDLLSQRTGANKQSLSSNEENLNRNRQKLSEKEKQRQVSTKWEALNSLIGSKEGEKYRNFAQALTFEHLIGLANQQLQKMSERYILKRVSDDKNTGPHPNPFELSVIDKFQNCEERTAQNLSGGEKFIVSLALALGLANMTSKNMKIDTMFIDEGFGTLDADFLDVALTALSNLQNEGKLIGVISHLTELKERIATHIDVIQKGNGHSRIEIRC
jgi:exonuclease SbcC